MKKILLLLILCLTFLNIFTVNAVDLKNDIVPETHEVLANWWSSPIDTVIIFVKDFIFSILWIIVVWVFLYFWFKLVTSAWNPEELKKTMMWLVYVIVWLAIMSLAWAAVKLVTTLNF